MGILIVSMTTWGEMGNWNSGQSLLKTLSESKALLPILQIPAEEIFPKFAEVGAAIKKLTEENSQNPEMVFMNYKRVMASLDVELQRLPEETILKGRLLLESILLKNDVSLVIGTKGVICKLLTEVFGVKVPVINYVTNHGHFQFVVHHCKKVTHHIVRIEQASRFLEAQGFCGPLATISCLGYLINPKIAALEPVSEPSTEEKTVAVVLSNRGGVKYKNIVEQLATHADHIKVIFIGLNDKALCEQIESIKSSTSGAADWEIYIKLENIDLLQKFNLLRVSNAFFITKASPNAVIESIYFELPMLLSRSGLPMEDWTCDFVREKQVGFIIDTDDQLNQHVRRIVSDRSYLQTVRKNIRKAKLSLDQEQIRKRFVSFFEAFNRP